MNSKDMFEISYSHRVSFCCDGEKNERYLEMERKMKEWNLYVFIITQANLTTARYARYIHHNLHHKLTYI